MLLYGNKKVQNSGQNEKPGVWGSNFYKKKHFFISDKYFSFIP